MRTTSLIDEIRARLGLPSIDELRAEVGLDTVAQAREQLAGVDEWIDKCGYDSPEREDRIRSTTSAAMSKLQRMLDETPQERIAKLRRETAVYMHLSLLHPLGGFWESAQGMLREIAELERTIKMMEGIG